MKKISFVPVGDRVLVRPHKEEKPQKKSSILIPESVEKPKPDHGIVLAIGDVKTVKVGDKVIFSKYAYDEVTIDGEDLYVFKEENILGIIK
jgi:chaperonin GroES